ncbi:glycoside hydrolase family 92 protein [Maribellus maritimus]|nr:glycoside hydrolase family 92 protein [Maribellus maritimus]MCG6188071.1 glycoside hydrolase family 92 protein [Maribellus maritimus]
MKAETLFTSIDNAREILTIEIPDKNFEEILAKHENIWNELPGKKK